MNDDDNDPSNDEAIDDWLLLIVDDVDDGYGLNPVANADDGGHD